MSAETHEPAVWIGCLACYNDARLVGEWFPALGADEVTLADVHRGSGGPRAGCEELWVFDHEHIPVRGELDPMAAAAWGELYDELDADHLWPALCAYVEAGGYLAQGHGDLPVLEEFLDRYQGHWDGFEDFAVQLIEDTGLHHAWPAEAVRYFDRERWIGDARDDYDVLDAPGTGVYVVRAA